MKLNSNYLVLLSFQFETSFSEIVVLSCALTLVIVLRGHLILYISFNIRYHRSKLQSVRRGNDLLLIYNVYNNILDSLILLGYMLFLETLEISL